jgi:ABC-type Fe3+-hydroxamate transport system substrate-binding protein
VTRVRVVSLVPSVTETLLSWGITPVGVTRFCEQPDLPPVGGTKDPDIAAVVALEPDVVVVNVEENRREDADALTAAGLDVHVTSIDSIADVEPELAALAKAVGREAPIDQLPRPPAVPLWTRAFIPIWRRPWMTMSGGCYGSSLLETLGVDNVFHNEAERYPTVELVDVVDRMPDVVLAPSEPYPFGTRHVAELSVLAPVVLVDGQDLFWWGARTPAAVERLRAQLAAVDLDVP